MKVIPKFGLLNKAGCLSKIWCWLYLIMSEKWYAAVSLQNFISENRGNWLFGFIALHFRLPYIVFRLRLRRRTRTKKKKIRKKRRILIKRKLNPKDFQRILGFIWRSSVEKKPWLASTILRVYLLSLFPLSLAMEKNSIHFDCGITR